jgi:hypothetical protein
MLALAWMQKLASGIASLALIRGLATFDRCLFDPSGFNPEAVH